MPPSRSLLSSYAAGFLGSLVAHVPFSVADDTSFPMQDAMMPSASHGHKMSRDDYERPPVVVLNYAGLTFNARTDLHNDNGSVKVRRSDLSFNVIFGPEQDFQFSIPFDFETSHYSFTGPDLRPGGKPILTDVRQLLLAPNIEAKIDEHWSVLGAAIFMYAGQYDVGNNESFRFGGFGGFKYRVTKDINFSIGFSGVTETADNNVFLPFAGIEWKFNEKTRLISEGNEVRLEHKFVEDLTIMFTGGYESRSYRLDRTGPVPDGVFREERVPLSVLMEWEPHPALTFDFTVGVNVYQRYSYDDRRGQRRFEDQGRMNPFFGFSMEFIF